MHSILQEIYENTKAAVERRKIEKPLNRLKDEISGIAPLRDFYAAVSRKDRVNVIAEIKKASPSAGAIRGEIDPGDCAAGYAEAGAAAISVLTEEKYFHGDLSFLLRARQKAPVPLLRKDFIFDPYQVHESLAAGADAILLIAAMVEKDRLKGLVELAFELGLDCLLEVHDEDDLVKALATPARIIGVNTRDLNDFSVKLETAEMLLPKIPDGKTVVIESGIKGPEDVRRFTRLGVRSFLVGETLMRSTDVRATLRGLKEAVNG